MGEDKISRALRVAAAQEEQKRTWAIEEARGYKVAMHNDLIQRNKYTLYKNAGGGLTLTEKKLLLWIISKITPETKELAPMELDLTEYCAVIGSGGEYNSGQTYKHLKETLTKLLGRVMWLDYGDGQEVNVRWLDRVVMQKGTRYVTVKLDNALEPYLLELKREYTMYPLHDVVRMKSRYAIDLYQFLQSEVFKGRIIKKSIKELRSLLDCLNTCYDNAANFRRKILDPAVADINSYSELRVNYELAKAPGSRAYTDVVFYVQNLRTSTELEDQVEANQRYNRVENEIANDPITLALVESLESPWPAFASVEPEIPGQVAMFGDDASENEESDDVEQ